MSIETPPDPKCSETDTVPALRREALLPNERNRGLGTVAVVCTMAGVASGLALATTLMAMQVADSMSVRQCPYRIVTTDVPTYGSSEPHGYFGIRHDHMTTVQAVLPGTPASEVDIRPGDHIVSVDGAPLRMRDEINVRLGSLPPGSQPTLVIERDGKYHNIRPTLAAYPSQY